MNLQKGQTKHASSHFIAIRSQAAALDSTHALPGAAQQGSHPAFALLVILARR